MTRGASTAGNPAQFRDTITDTLAHDLTNYIARSLPETGAHSDTDYTLNHEKPSFVAVKTRKIQKPQHYLQNR